jgi:magnesium transporter
MFEHENERVELVKKIEDLVTRKRYTELRSLLDTMEAADIALVLEDLSEENMPLVFRLLPKEPAAEVFVELDSDEQELLIRGFSNTELREVLDELYLDDAVDLVEEMPANVVKRILKHADPETRKGINDILKYPEDSAGSIMTTEFVDLKQDMTVADAFKRIRQTGPDKETINIGYVIDEWRHLIGLVSIRTLLLTGEDAVIGDIMEKNIISVKTLDDQEFVASSLSKYDFLALPVVDTENRLVGIVTVDDAIDVLQDEATEDIEKMAAIVPTDKPYLKTSAFDMFKARIPWLLLLMISATFTGQIISRFEDALATVTILTAYIPMLMDTGGNAGSQSAVTVIRGISLNEIQFRDTFRVLWKEIEISVMCGIVLAVANFAKLMLVDRMLFHNSAVTPMVAMVVCCTLIVTVFTSKLVGAALPLLAEKVGWDPAVMASPLITTIVDAVSLIIYFSFATSMLHLR